MSQSKQSHALRMIALSATSAVLAIAVAWADRAGLVPGPLRVPVVLVPVLPLVAFFAGITRWLRDVDELERLIHLEAMLVQFSATGILVMGYGMLAKAGLVPDLRVTAVFPVLWLALFGFWMVGLAWVRRKYR